MISLLNLPLGFEEGVGMGTGKGLSYSYLLRKFRAWALIIHAGIRMERGIDIGFEAAVFFAKPAFSKSCLNIEEAYDHDRDLSWKSLVVCFALDSTYYAISLNLFADPGSDIGLAMAGN